MSRLKSAGPVDSLLLILFLPGMIAWKVLRQFFVACLFLLVPIILIRHLLLLHSTGICGIHHIVLHFGLIERGFSAHNWGSSHSLLLNEFRVEKHQALVEYLERGSQLLVILVEFVDDLLRLPLR